MRNSSKLLLAALTAALTLAVGVGSASASRGLEVGSPGTITNTGRLTFSDGFGFFRVRCDVTMTLTLHRSIPKVERTLAGYVRDARVANCEGGTVVVLTETTPWHIKYLSFTGTLPSITSVRLALESQFLLTIGSERCLYIGGVGTTVQEGVRIRGIRSDERELVPLHEEAPLNTAFCPGSGRMAGTLNSTPVVTLRLI